MKLADKARVLTRFVRFWTKFTRQDMQAFTGFHRSTVDRIIDGLHETHDIHVAHYAEDRLGRLSVEVFAWGKKRDARRMPLSGAERQRALVRRKKKST